jgi:hypothetical protein
LCGRGGEFKLIKCLALGSLSGNAFAQGAANSLINQGVGIITGQQKGFSWSAVAVSAIAAPLSQKINDTLFGKADANTGIRTGGAFASKEVAQFH